MKNFKITKEACELLTRMCDSLKQVQIALGNPPAMCITGGSVIDALSGKNPKDLDIMIQGKHFKNGTEAFEYMQNISMRLSELGANSIIYEAYPDRLAENDFNRKWWGCIKVNGLNDIPWEIDILIARTTYTETFKSFDSNINAVTLMHEPRLMHWWNKHPLDGYCQINDVSEERMQKTRQKYEDFIKIQEV